jgi:3-phosphoshikimate 1-carboxyvinyltransferase
MSVEAAPGYPEVLEIQPLPRPTAAAIDPPGSKSLTNRALILAALAGRGRGCRLDRVLDCEDTAVMITALRALDFQVEVPPPYGPGDGVLRVGAAGGAGVIPATAADLFVGNSGTTMRFLTAMLSLGEGRYRLDGVPRMRERPMEDLLTALRQLGVRAFSERGNGCPPVVVEANGLSGGRVCIRGDVSSQFLSGLLLAAPRARGDVEIEVAGPLVSEPYVAMTMALMRQWSAAVHSDRPGHFVVPGRQEYRAQSFVIEPDASAASYFFGAAAVTGGYVWVPRLTTASLQGDVGFVDVLERMGCLVSRTEAGINVQGRPLHGIDVDMNAISDTVMTLAAVALFAEGPTTIRNVAHIRHKETDRLRALATELRRLGAGVEERPDGLTVTPGSLRGTTVETYNDHRMAMSLALVGLRVPGVVIRNPGCVAKTYPRFFDDLERLRVAAV